MLRILVLAVLPISLVWSGQLSAQEVGVDTDSPAKVISSRVTISSNTNLTYRTAKVDLGRVSAGSTLVVDLELLNPFEDEIVFSKAKLQCSCINFRSDVDRIPGNASRRFKITIKSPDSAPNATVSSAITLVDADDIPQVRIGVHYRLKGLLAVQKDKALLRVSKASPIAEVKIPVTVTAPIKSESIRVSASPSIRDLPIRLVEEDGQLFVVASGSVEDVIDGPIGGEVALRDEVSGKVDGFYLSLEEIGVFSLNPTDVRLYEGDTEGRYIGSAILKINREVLDDDDRRKSPAIKQERSKRPTVELYVDGKEADVSVKQLGHGGVYRIQVVVNSVESLKDSKVEWHVRYMDKRFSKSGALFLDR